ncbi:hypothetical protein [Paraflavitalea speifideaquila]|uniref:hypothetical protein n=1 Tax=Paraflavitalea speifideaquila TaxID=3076558 RepID=UPI0028E9F715|nr:hypothetical protein [Paraflavitalea speifideiaquila]
MKRATTLLALLCLLLNSQQSLAKIWRVNNNPGVAADFTDLQSAHNGAAGGDTLHIEGSPNSYGGATFNKKLIVLGPGYFLDEYPNSQALLHSGKVGGVTYNMGSEGSVIMGIDFLGSGIVIFTDDIIIRRNKFSAPNGATPDYSIGTINLYYHSNNSGIPANNVIISQNYGVKIAVNAASTGVLITNNFIAFESWEAMQPPVFALQRTPVRSSWYRTIYFVVAKWLPITAILPTISWSTDNLKARAT